jgi:hypothetical protein
MKTVFSLLADHCYQSRNANCYLDVWLVCGGLSP